MGVGKWKKVQMGISLIFTKNTTRYQTTYMRKLNVYIYIYIAIPFYLDRIIRFIFYSPINVSQ